MRKNKLEKHEVENYDCLVSCRHCIGRNCSEYFMKAIKLGVTDNGFIKVSFLAKGIGKTKSTLNE